MGVQGLLPMLRRVAPESIQSIAASSFSSLFPVVAIDGTLLLIRNFRSQYTALNYSFNHFKWAFKLARYCRRQKIMPIVVFDNPIPNEHKAEEHEKRKLLKENVIRDRNDISKRVSLQKTFESVLLSETKQFNVPDFDLDEVLYSLENLLEDVDLENTKLPTPVNPEDLESASKSPDVRVPSPNSIDKKLKQKKLEKVEELYNQLIGLLSDLGSFSDVNEYLKTLKPRSDFRDLKLCVLYLLGKLDLETLRSCRLKVQEELIKYERRLYSPTKQHFEELIELLKILNIPVTYAPIAVEAEAFASAIYKKNLATVVATQDTDTLALGAPMVSDFLDNSQLFYHFLTYVNPMRICDSLNISYRQFQIYCLMCGTDFSTRIPKIGPVRALELIQEHRDVSSILSHLSLSNKFNVPEDYEKQMKIALERFTELPNKNEFFQFITASQKSFLQMSDTYYLDLERQALKVFNLQPDFVEHNVLEYYHY
ncbi:XP-G family nuclease [Schizosaccharomyces octosporus yFS286]|uniref:XP-G family nuclease n=1 Tax=Schizosaccharomyces octosporus (strain yFS286) TaxID=483514 RepID=S9PZ85_SCHOY|nr:XP-G family nuclease [Schizosaccharomyces octosporus yFS286]EPX72773.1 XP-G family nuclease [Schizosaccharomyces octosporus yFS286]